MDAITCPITLPLTLTTEQLNDILDNTHSYWLQEVEGSLDDDTQVTLVVLAEDEETLERHIVTNEALAKALAAYAARCHDRELIQFEGVGYTVYTGYLDAGHCDTVLQYAAFDRVRFE